MSKTACYQQSFSWRFLLPNYWATWLGLFLLWLLDCLPLKVKRKLSYLLGAVLYSYNSKRRHIVETNLSMAFPQAEESSRHDMARELFCHAVFVLLDYPLLLWAGKKTLNARIKIKGLEHLSRCQKEQRNVILLTCHMLGLEYGALGLTQHAASVGLVNPARNELFEWLITRGRTRFQGQLYQRNQGLRPVIKAIKQKRVFYYLPDEDLGEKAQIQFAPFFGVESATINALPRLAAMTSAAVLPAVTILDAKTGVYTLEIAPALEDFPLHNKEITAQENIQRMNICLEQLIMRAPTQYMWSLRLFQTRQNSAVSPYKY